MISVLVLRRRAAAARLFPGAGLLALALGCPPALHAHGTQVGELRLDHPYAVPSLPGQTEGFAYLRRLRHGGHAPERLIAASTPAAARVELQCLAPATDQPGMRAVPAIDLPAGADVTLHPAGPCRLRLVQLQRPLVDGDRFALTLTFEHAGAQTVQVWVQTPRDTASHPHGLPATTGSHLF